MAENKKSFIMYADWIHTVRKLTDADAGQLLKHLLMYVNDEDPTTENVIVDIAFEPIKQQLKRDLQKYEKIREKRSLAGQASAEKKKQVLTSVESVEQNQQVLTSVESVKQTSTNSTVNDNVNVNVNDTVNDNDINNKENAILKKSLTLEKRKKNFIDSIAKAADEINLKDKEMMNAFFRYWSQVNENGTKMHFEKQKTFEVKMRLITWRDKDLANKQRTTTKRKESDYD